MMRDRKLPPRVMIPTRLDGPEWVQKFLETTALESSSRCRAAQSEFCQQDHSTLSNHGLTLDDIDPHPLDSESEKTSYSFESLWRVLIRLYQIPSRGCVDLFGCAWTYVCLRACVYGYVYAQCVGTELHPITCSMSWGFAAFFMSCLFAKIRTGAPTIFWKACVSEVCNKNDISVWQCSKIW